MHSSECYHYANWSTFVFHTIYKLNVRNNTAAILQNRRNSTHFIVRLRRRLVGVVTQPFSRKISPKMSFLVHLYKRLMCTIVITCCPSSVHPSVRPSLTFRIFDFSSETTEQNSNKTWQEARTQHPLPSLCFSCRSEKQDGRPGLWLAETFSTSPLTPLNGIQGNLTGSKISTSSTSFVLFGAIWKTRWPPWPLIGWDIFHFSSETTEQNTTNLGRKQDLNVLYQVCVFRADRKNKMAVLASDWPRHFRLLLWNR